MVHWPLIVDNFIASAADLEKFRVVNIVNKLEYCSSRKKY